MDDYLMLGNFCAKNDLVVLNSLFKKRRLFTWRSPDGKTHNMIDFCLAKSSLLNSIKDTKAFDCIDKSFDFLLIDLIFFTNVLYWG